MAKDGKPQLDPRRPKPLIVPPRKEHTHTTILLHDKGDKGRVFGREFLKSTGLQDHFPTVQFVFPCAFNAPTSDSSDKTTHSNGDAKRRTTPPTQWFDDPSQMRRVESATASLAETARFLQRLIHDEAKVLTKNGKYRMHEAHKRIFIGGHGQGGAAALLYLLGSHRRLGGFIGLDTTMPWQLQLEMALEVGMHGEDDFGVVRGVDYVRDLLGFEHLEEKGGEYAKSLLHLRTPVFLGHGAPQKHGRIIASVLAAGFRMEVTERLGASKGRQWYAQAEDLEAVLGFVEGIGVPRTCLVSEDDRDFKR
ncbi:hypothetical protein BJY01DRAFT_223686 [Aspergillus pseudoustus]|uniref:Phospholipase/carboxylesterase/thioesterase domain-containing protein n=1 Tax=Aspergillus pseudoustus TaxID=1810923 RepID=A0ABR4J6S0_9EURO